MSQFKQMKNWADGLRSRIEKILRVDRNDLYGKDRLGDISFEEHGKDRFEMVFQLLEKLQQCDLDRVPSYYTERIAEHIDRYETLLENARALDIKISDAAPVGKRDNIVSQVEGLYQPLCELAYPIIALGSTDDEIKSKQLLELLQNICLEAEKKMEKVTKESDEILAIARGTAADAGVSSNARRYEAARERHANLAWVCFCSVIGLLVLLIGSMAITYSNIYHKTTGEVTLGYQEVAIIFVAILLIYAVFFCSRLFNAEKHNEIVNDNKANALGTFLAFVKATEDGEIKDQILLHAATAIFANTPTAFSKEQGMPLPPSVEFIKRGTRSVERKNDI